MNIHPKWTEERVKRLEELLKLRWTAEQVGRDLGVTRNAVIGKAHRLGLALSERRPPRPKKVKRLPEPRPLVKLTPIKVPKPERIPVFRVRTTTPYGRMRFGDLKAFSDQNPNQCRRFLKGEPANRSGFVCGLETPIGKAWCKECSKRMFQAPALRRRAA